MTPFQSRAATCLSGLLASNPKSADLTAAQIDLLITKAISIAAALQTRTEGFSEAAIKAQAEAKLALPSK